MLQEGSLWMWRLQPILEMSQLWRLAPVSRHKRARHCHWMYSNPLERFEESTHSLFQVNPSASHVGKSGMGDDSSKVACVPVSSGLVPTQLNTQPLKVSTTPK